MASWIRLDPDSETLDEAQVWGCSNAGASGLGRKSRLEEVEWADQHRALRKPELDPIAAPSGNYGDHPGATQDPA